MLDPKIFDDLNERYVDQGWYGFAHPDGWDEIVLELHNKLAEKYPDYRVQQVKEKFGGLRYYFTAPPGWFDDEETMAWIREAQEAAARTCQVCGKSGASSAKSSGWVATLCEEHAKEG